MSLLFALFVLIVGTLQKRLLVKFLHVMSEGSKQKIDCRRSYMAFYVLSDNRWMTFVVQMLTCWSGLYGVLPSVVDFFASSHLVCVFTFGLTVVTKLDLLVNTCNGISLVLGKMRNCVMQNTNGKMQNEKMRNNGDLSTRQATWKEFRIGTTSLFCGWKGYLAS